MKRLAAFATLALGGMSFAFAQVEKVWVARYNGPGINGRNYDDPRAMIVEADGSVLVTGRSEGTNSFGFYEFATVKYDANGTQLWVARYSDPAQYDFTPRAMAVDS